VAYSLIVVTTTSLCVDVCIGQKESYWLENFEIHSAQFNSLLFFQVMAQVAFWAYLPNMKSLYELTIGTFNPPLGTLQYRRLTDFSPSSHQNVSVRVYDGIHIWEEGK